MLGDPQILRALFQGVGLTDVAINTYPGMARFPSLQSWMYTDVKGWTLANVLDEVQFDLLRREAERELRSFVRKDGSVAFDAPAHIITAAKE